MARKYNYKTKKENGKNGTGAPSKYNSKYCADIVTFFADAPRWQLIDDSSSCGSQGDSTHSKKIPAQLPTFYNFAKKIGVNEDTIVVWAKVYPEFSAAYNAAKQEQKQWLIEVGASGLCPPASFIFIAKNITDMRDKTEQDINVKTFEHFKKEKDKY